MNNVALITCAGLSSRFSNSIKKNVLKAIYFENDYTDSILANQINLLLKNNIDTIYIVGGYLFDKLYEFINTYYKNFNIILINNEQYNLGSGLSFILGIEEIKKNKNIDSIVFLEGDLYINNSSIKTIIDNKKNVITYNDNLIEADKSVLFYQNKDGYLKYIYDTSHMHIYLSDYINYIGNSGQIWKFVNLKKLYDIINNLNVTEQEGTNLIPIGKYFYDEKNLDIIKLVPWINCNTINDYKTMMEYKYNNGYKL